MDLLTTSIVLCGAYILAMVGISFWSARKADPAGFVIGNRNVGILGTAASLGAGWRDVGFIWFWIAMAYTSGYAIMWVIAFVLVGITWAMPFLKRARRLAAENNYVAPPDIVRGEIGGASGLMVSFAEMFVYLMLAAAQFLVLGPIFSGLFDVSFFTISMIMMITVAVYLWAGGYQNVIRTDIIQSVLMAFILIVPFTFANLDWKSFTHVESFFSMSAWDMFFLSAPMLLIAFTGGDTLQRCYSAKDNRIVSWGLRLGIIFTSLLTLGLVFIGITLRDLFGEGDPNALFFTLFESDVAHPIILSILLMALMAMGMSTLDTATYIFSSTMMKNILRMSETENRKKYIRWTRVLMVAFLVAATLIALLSSENIMNFLLGLISVMYISAPSYIIAMTGLAFQSKTLDRGLVVCWILGFAAYLYLMIHEYFAADFAYMCVPIGANIILSFGWYAFVRFVMRGRVAAS